MPSKRNWLKREQEPRKERPDLYQRLKKEIIPVRKQGEPPSKDAFTFSKYVCDLCSTTHRLSALKQCAVCGRWACTACWTPEYYVCNSCGGILKLHLIPQGDSR